MGQGHLENSSLISLGKGICKALVSFCSWHVAPCLAFSSAVEHQSLIAWALLWLDSGEWNGALSWASISEEIAQIVWEAEGICPSAGPPEPADPPQLPLPPMPADPPDPPMPPMPQPKAQQG